MTTYLDAGSVDIEDALTENYGLTRSKVKVKCPGCHREGAPLCSPKTREVGGGWRWVGVDHRQPETDYETTCRCGCAYRFTTYIPQ